MLSRLALVSALVSAALAAPLDVRLFPAPSTGPGQIDLGTAKNFTILSKSGISSVPASSITGNIGVLPIAATGLTGFSLVYSGGPYSTSAQVNGNVYASDYSSPTPAELTQASSDMERAYTSAATLQNPTSTNSSGGKIGGVTFTPGLYKWTSGVSALSDFTISGSSTDSWVFQISGVLFIGEGVSSTLSGGALGENVFWQVAGGATIDVGGQLDGVVGSKTTVILNTGATLRGRALAQTAVTLQKAVLTPPAEAPCSFLGCSFGTSPA